MKQGNDSKPGPTSGRGASSALEAMIRRRITPPPNHAPSSKRSQDSSPRIPRKQRG